RSILPIGSTEQHGPTGLIGTDALCADLVARGVGERASAIVAPPLNFGMAQHHMAFAGSMTLRPETLLAVLVDLLASLAVHGFERCLIINGHGANMATIMTAISELHARSSLGWPGSGGQLHCRLRNWWTPKAVAELQEEIFGDRDGSHATASEIALTQFAFPDRIKSADLDPACAPKSSGFTDAADFRERYPDGRVGSDPSLCTPEHGKRLYHAAVEALSEDYTAFLEEV
ncbi:MAG: creatininase family protein, partial [Alphaproteobacteria bacterium]|nr:creatininase family protein [Alphaproteobacteria bacterium]